MSFWIEGWIKVARIPDTAEPHAWFGVVNVGSLVDVADEDSEWLFGLSKQCVSGEKSVIALAANRGAPLNPSEQVREAFANIAAHEMKYGPGECGGYTHAGWTEIREYELTASPEESQWGLSFRLARLLSDELGPDRIRFVVWFRW